MGNPFLLQACLRLPEDKIPRALELGKEYPFSKSGHRLYQIKVPMDLRTENWKAIGRCVITQLTLGNGKTEGTFVMVKIFSKEEAEYATKTYVSDEEVEEVLQNHY